MVERVCEINCDDSGFAWQSKKTDKCRESLFAFVNDIVREWVRPGQSARVTVRVEPLPERVKWPWPDVSRVRVGPRCIDGHRNTLILTDAGWSLAWAIKKDLFGTWPANESRIASNDNGFVKLSEVENGE